MTNVEKLNDLVNFTQKEARTLESLLNELGEPVRKHQEAMNQGLVGMGALGMGTAAAGTAGATLASAGVGAGIGALVSDKKNRLRNALIGALAGGSAVLIPAGIAGSIVAGKGASAVNSANKKLEELAKNPWGHLRPL